MKGVEYAVAAVVDSLANNIESRLDILNTENGTVPFQVALTPAFVSPTQMSYDSVGIDEWPFLLVVPDGDPSVERLNVDDDGAKQYNVVYSMKVFAWVRGDTWPATAAAQRRLAQAVKECLLAYQKLSDTLSILEPSIATKYSDIVTDQHLNSTVGAAWISVQVKSKERLAPVNPAYPPTQTTGSTGQLMTPSIPQGPAGA